MALHKYLPCRFLALKCSYPPQNTSLPSARENSSPWFISCSISCGGECVTRSKRSGNSFPNLPHSMEKLHIAICEYLCVYTCMDVSKVRLSKELLLPQYNVYIARLFIRTETSSTNVLDISWGKWLNQAQSPPKKFQKTTCPHCLTYPSGGLWENVQANKSLIKERQNSNTFSTQ